MNIICTVTASGFLPADRYQSEVAEKLPIGELVDVKVSRPRNNPNDRPGEADLIVAKNKDGETGVVTVTWQGRYQRFVNFTGTERYPDLPLSGVAA